MKIKLSFIFLAISFVLSGCTQVEETTAQSSDAISPEEEAYIKNIAENMGVTEETTEFAPLSTSSNDADFDLTTLDTDSAYLETINISNNPTYYEGKTIHLKGKYDTQFSSETNTHYHFVIVNDSDGCVGGLEFIWEGEHNIPDDYPTVNTPIEITGVYDKYEENGSIYYYLKTDNITILQ